MSALTGELFGPVQAAEWIAVPRPDDDKYSRGVLGFVTGSSRYPGAAVLGVEAALHTGVGMVRYLGSGRPTRLVLQRRPEAVTSDGRVQAWVLGSGQDAADRDDNVRALLDAALAQRVPTILDGGALDLHSRLAAPGVVTPHAGELAALLGVPRDQITAEPARWATQAAATLRCTVLLKGHTTHVASPSGAALRVRNAPSWLATAGAGDALAGILGALVATHHERVADDPDALVPLAATAAVVHGLAAERASDGGPFTILGLCAMLPSVVAQLVRGGGIGA
ncbi:MAG TPA: ADP/ATP-dependent (S)-NAD(P)H-hydrate dehydratase [Pseudolysinimonas sp.]|nr:ADP/ATP-dependent (S)-NAD(P)H-hydrate dehydratase [Pseudolysinimonas sp.]